MILKNLFFSLQKEDLKRRIWLVALLLLLGFLLMPVLCAMYVEDYKSYLTERVWIMENIRSCMGPSNWPVMALSVGSAIVCGISSFAFLHSRKKVDFYHSIPVRRELLFIVNYLNGFLFYLAAYVTNILLCTAVLKINNYLTKEIWGAILDAFAVNMTYFILTYTIVVIAVLLTGNFVVSCFGTAVLLLYGPTLMLVKEMFFREFFITYYPETRLVACLEFLSPVGAYSKTIESWEEGGSITFRLLITLLVSIVLFIFAIFLYQKRPSETAGKSLVFMVSQPVIKVLLVILLSLGGGILFRNVVSNNEDGWFVFGLVLTLIISSSVIEIIYSVDIRSAFHHKIQTLCCLVISGLIAAVFRYDLFHYDTYLPEKETVESISLSVSGLDTNINYYTNVNGRYEYNNSENYQLRYMKLTDIDAAYQLAELGVEMVSDDTDEYNLYSNRYTYIIKFNLDNGDEICRSYDLELDQSYELLQKLYGIKEFKEAHFPINAWDSNDIGQISLRYYSDILNSSKFGMDGSEGYQLKFDKAGKHRFLQTYKEELNAMTLEELTNTPSLSLQLEVNDHDIYDYYIYPSFQRTLALLSDCGLDITKEFNASDILQIEVYDNSPDVQINSEEPVKAKTTKNQYTYSDPEEIELILPHLVDGNYFYANYSVLQVEQYFSAYLSVFNEDYGETIKHEYYFRKGEIPKFILDDLSVNY